MRRLALLLTGLAILAAINVTVWRYERAMSSGEVVLLRLAPVDPRPDAGDYMRLNYELARQLGNRQQDETPADTLVIRLDEQHVASWVEGASRISWPAMSGGCRCAAAMASGSSAPTPTSSKRAPASSTRRRATANFACRRVARRCWWGFAMSS